MFKVGDIVKVKDREYLKLHKFDGPGLANQMFDYCGNMYKIDEIFQASYDELRYRLEGLDRRRRAEDRLESPKENKLFKKGTCVCGKKNTHLINIQGDYICKDCVDLLFKSKLGKKH